MAEHVARGGAHETDAVLEKGDEAIALVERLTCSPL
jgi:hypothetical protein